MIKASLLSAIFIILFFCSKVTSQSFDVSGIGFRRADSVASLYPGYSLANLKDLSDKLTLPLSTDAEKFRSIYKWVCTNIDNDFEYFERNKTKREKLQDDPKALAEWDRKFAPMVFKRLLQHHSTVCTGYAYLIKELSYHAGIECVIVNGYGRNSEANIGGPGIPNHSWNAVKLNNKWYLCDPTWSSGIIDTQQALFIEQFNEFYFLAAPDRFALNHYPLDTNWLLLDKKPTLSAFLHSPLIYNSALRNGILPEMPATFRWTIKKGEPVEIRFSAEAKPEKLALQIVRGSQVVEKAEEVSQSADGLFSISHFFPAKGLYSVHVRQSGEYLFTYEVEVLK